MDGAPFAIGSSAVCRQHSSTKQKAIRQDAIDSELSILINQILVRSDVESSDINRNQPKLVVAH